jgi:hypothetical protein
MLTPLPLPRAVPAELRAICGKERLSGKALPKRLTTNQRSVVEALVKAHGSDFGAMARDRKLNRLQHAEGVTRHPHSFPLRRSLAARCQVHTPSLSPSLRRMLAQRGSHVAPGHANRWRETHSKPRLAARLTRGLVPWAVQVLRNLIKSYNAYPTLAGGGHRGFHAPKKSC